MAMRNKIPYADGHDNLKKEQGGRYDKLRSAALLSPHPSLSIFYSFIFQADCMEA